MSTCPLPLFLVCIAHGASGSKKNKQQNPCQMLIFLCFIDKHHGTETQPRYVNIIRQVAKADQAPLGLSTANEWPVCLRTNRQHDGNKKSWSTHHNVNKTCVQNDDWWSLKKWIKIFKPEKLCIDAKPQLLLGGFQMPSTGVHRFASSPLSANQRLSKPVKENCKKGNGSRTCVYNLYIYIYVIYVQYM